MKREQQPLDFFFFFHSKNGMRKRPSHIEFTNKTTIQKEEEKSSNKK
jgi:hypothetical protein